MDFFSLILSSLIIFFAIRYGFKSLQIKNRKKWFGITGSLSIIIGTIGFFSPIYSPYLSERTEWPVGNADAIIKYDDGFIVLHEFSRRIQIYDKDWIFQNGWYVNTQGGNFKASLDSMLSLHVVTVRGNWKYNYNLDGKLISQVNYKENGKKYGDFPNMGEKGKVPTPFFYHLFANSFIAWIVYVLGIIFLGLSGLNKITTRPKSPNKILLLGLNNQ